MSEEKTFRVQARLNKVEYADLYEDLENYPEGADRAGRVRKLLRIGLAVDRGLLRVATQGNGGDNTNQVLHLRDVSSPSETIKARMPSEESPVEQKSEVDGLLEQGFDIRAFGLKKGQG